MTALTSMLSSDPSWFIVPALRLFSLSSAFAHYSHCITVKIPTLQSETEWVTWHLIHLINSQLLRMLHYQNTQRFLPCRLFLLIWAISRENHNLRWVITLVLACTYICALRDEIYQLFPPGRFFEFLDPVSEFLYDLAELHVWYLLMKS